jgi:hypothetical protein
MRKTRKGQTADQLTLWNDAPAAEPITCAPVAPAREFSYRSELAHRVAVCREPHKPEGWEEARTRYELCSEAERWYRDWLYQWGEAHGWPDLSFRMTQGQGKIKTEFTYRIMASEVCWRMARDWAQYEYVVRASNEAEWSERQQQEGGQ